MVILRFLLATLVVSVVASTAQAQRRFNDIEGVEVVITRAPAVSTPTLTAAGRVQGAVEIVAGPDLDAANNDFRRIQNAITAAVTGDTLIFSGTFDFTAVFAASAWALGNDGLAGTADDYAVLVPQNVNDLTLTATGLGNATIQGPGDLAAVNLEGFLLFDGGDNHNCTISNLRILDFDLAIGMFYGPGNTDAFSGCTISNNFIRIPNDLNGVVAPADVNQNIGLHYSLGVNQSIIGNVFEVPGNGVSDPSSASSSVGMQSNTGGGSTYDGLLVADNVLQVLNAAKANAQTVLGYWENGLAHTSDITISGNQFLNLAAANDPALNLQRAFRVTSHSSPSTTVWYVDNVVSGSNIGLQWIAGANFSGNAPVVLELNALADCTTGVLIQSEGVVHLADNTISASGTGAGVHLVTGTIAGSGSSSEGMLRNIVAGGNGDGVWIEAGGLVAAPLLENRFDGNAGFGVRNQSAPLVVAEYNWWGSDLAVEVAAEVSGNVDYDPWRDTASDLFADAFE